MPIQTKEGRELSTKEWAKSFDLRGCIVPPKGMLYLQSDWAQIEVIALATVLDALLKRTSNLTKIINDTVCVEGRAYPNDVHTMLAAMILEESYEKIFPLRKKDPKVAQARQMAKAAVFGLPGGMSSRTFMLFAKDAYGVSLTLKQAQNLKKLWYSLLGEDMHEYFDYIESNYTEGIVQLVSARVRGGLSYCAAANTLFQGLAADAAKYTLCVLEWAAEVSPLELQQLVPGARSAGFLKECSYVLNQFIHDEFIGVAKDPGGNLPFLQERYEAIKKQVAGNWETLRQMSSSPDYPTVCLALVEKGMIMIDCAAYYFRGMTIREEGQITRRWSK